MAETGLDPVIGDEEQAYRAKIFDRYNSTSYAQRNDLSAAGLDRVAKSYVREFGPYMPEDPNAPILEIGCGGGSFLATCQTLGYTDVRGFDISAEMVDFCHQRGLENVACDDGLSYLRHSDERFALIVASDVLEHVPKQDGLQLMQEAHRRLLPGGRVILRVPNMSNPLNIQARYGDYTHEVGFSKESLEQFLRNAGFEIEALHSAAGTHRRWLAKILFDRLLWKAFRLLCYRVFKLKTVPQRGKNLIAVGRRGDDNVATGDEEATANYRAAYFDTYLSTLYSHLPNDLSPAGLARATQHYRKQMGSFLPQDKDLPILEIGCGSGGFLRSCAEMGHRQVEGIDISPEQVQFCRERGLEDVVCSDGSSYLEQRDTAYGAIVMSDVLEHIPREEVHSLLARIHSSLLPGGRLIVRVPNLSNPLNLRTRYVDLTHELGFTLESLAQVFEQHGFQVETVHGLWGPHGGLLPRLFFDRLGWWATRHFCRHVLGIETPLSRGKNLLAVGVKA